MGRVASCCIVLLPKIGSFDYCVEGARQGKGSGGGGQVMDQRKVPAIYSGS